MSFDDTLARIRAAKAIRQQESETIAAGFVPEVEEASSDDAVDESQYSVFTYNARHGGVGLHMTGSKADAHAAAKKIDDDPHNTQTQTQVYRVGSDKHTAHMRHAGHPILPKQYQQKPKQEAVEESAVQQPVDEADGLHAKVSKALHAAGHDGHKLFASPGEGYHALHAALAHHGLQLGADHHDHGGEGHHSASYPIHRTDGTPVHGAHIHVARTGGVGDREGATGSDMPMKGRHEFVSYLHGKKLHEAVQQAVDESAPVTPHEHRYHAQVLKYLTGKGRFPSTRKIEKQRGTELIHHAQASLGMELSKFESTAEAETEDIDEFMADAAEGLDEAGALKPHIVRNIEGEVRKLKKYGVEHHSAVDAVASGYEKIVSKAADAHQHRTFTAMAAHVRAMKEDAMEIPFAERVRAAARGIPALTEAEKAAKDVADAGLPPAEVAACALVSEMAVEELAADHHVVHVKYKLHGTADAKETVHHLIRHAKRHGMSHVEADGYDGEAHFHFKSKHAAKSFHHLASQAKSVHHTSVHHQEPAYEAYKPDAKNTANLDHHEDSVHKHLEAIHDQLKHHRRHYDQHGGEEHGHRMAALSHALAQVRMHLHGFHSGPDNGKHVVPMHKHESMSREEYLAKLHAAANKPEFHHAGETYHIHADNAHLRQHKAKNHVESDKEGEWGGSHGIDGKEARRLHRALKKAGHPHEVIEPTGHHTLHGVKFDESGEVVCDDLDEADSTPLPSETPENQEAGKPDAEKAKVDTVAIHLLTPMGEAHEDLATLLHIYGGVQASGGYHFPARTAQAFVNKFMQNGGRAVIIAPDGTRHGPNEGAADDADFDPLAEEAASYGVASIDSDSLVPDAPVVDEAGAPKEKIPGTHAVAQRIANAHSEFHAQLAKNGDISNDDARDVGHAYIKHKLARVDAVLGRVHVKHGSLYDKDTIRTALGNLRKAKKA